MSTQEPFELIELLGTGGFAHTYLARVVDEDLLEDFGVGEVALKIPLNTKKERILRRELELNASLYLRMKDMDMSNIVRYFGFAVFRGQIVMAMEYIRHGSLRKLLGNPSHPRQVPHREACRITLGVLKGLAAIHQEHVFHRDIKPENILMDGETPKIADLGIARMLASNELASTTTGTIYYMSPEILSEQGAAFPSDLWSLGVMFYEMLTGKLPFGSFATPIGTMVDLIRHGDHLPAHEVCPDVPRPLSRLIDRALRKDPAQRFATAAEMYAALSGLEDGEDGELGQELAAVRRLMTGSDQADLSRAEGLLQSLIARHPGSVRVHQQLGELYNLCQRYHDAISAFTRGLQVDPDNIMLHWDLALAYLKSGRGSKAVRHLEKVVAEAPDASLRRHAGTLLQSLRGGAR